MRLRLNFLGGILDQAIDDNEMELESSAFTVLPVIEDGDYLPIILDPDGFYGDPEILYIIDHAFGASAVTVADNGAATPVRGAKELTEARSHPAETYWIHGPTAMDFLGKHDIDLPKGEIADLDEEFDDDLSAWTAVSGSSGTINLITGTAGIYDLDSRPGTLLVQNSSVGPVQLRKTATLSDNKSLVASFSMAALSNSATGWVNDHQRIILALNNSTVGPITGLGGVALYLDTEIDTAKIVYTDTAGVFIYESPEQSGLRLVGERFYFRIAREGAAYYGFYSGDGESWLGFPGIVLASPPTYLWVSFTSATTGAPLPIHSCHWIREGSNNLIPW